MLSARISREMKARVRGEELMPLIPGGVEILSRITFAGKLATVNYYDLFPPESNLPGHFDTRHGI